MRIKLFLSFGLSAFFLWWALKGLNFHEIAGAFKEVHWGPVCWMPLTMLATHFFRARRWRILVKPLKDVPLWELFKINAVGFMAITIFPLRLGEFTRPLLLKKRHQIAFTTGLATIVVERVFDALTTALILVVGLMNAPFADKEIPLLGIGMKTMAYSALLIVIPLFGFLFLAVLQRKRAISFVAWASRFLPERMQKSIQEISHNFFAGLEALPNVWALAQLFLESVGVWGSVAIGYMLALNAFQLHLHWSAAYSVLGITAVGISLPAAPGFVGTIQVFIQAALALYGIDKAIGFAFSVVTHAVNLFYTLLAGLCFLPSMSLGVGKLYDEASHQA